MSAALTRANKREHGTNELTQPAKTGAGKQDARQVIEGATVSDRASISGHGMTLLMHAACDGLAGTVQGLLDRGAEVNAQRSDGLNALALAAFFGHSQVVWLLLEHGADLDATGRAGTLPEMWADARGFLGVGDILREARPKQTEPTDLCTAVIDEPARFRPVENETPQQTNFPDSGVERSSSEDATEPEMMLVGPAPAEECTVGTSLTGDMPNDKPEQTLEQSVFTQPVREVGPNVIDEIMDSEITLVRATPAEECTEEKGEVTEDLPNHNPEHAQEPVLAQPVRVLKTLPDIQDPPPLLVPEFRPGSAFVARVTSSRKNLVALGLAVWLISGGIAYFLIPKILESWEGMRTEAATKTTTLPAEPGNPGAESGTRVSGAVETTSPAKSESISATPSHETKDPAAVTPSDTFANREGVESTSQVRSDEVSEKVQPASLWRGI